MIKRFISATALLSTALLALPLVACGGGDGSSGQASADVTSAKKDTKTGPTTPVASATPPAPTGTTPGGPVVPPPATDDAGVTTPPVPTACPNLQGQWAGTLEGKITGQPGGAVTGTVEMGFVAGSKKDDFDLDKASKLFLQVDIGFGPTPFTQGIAGTASCGVLDAAQDTTVLGIKIHATAKCTFTESGCTGVWTAAPADNSAMGTGTFTLKRK